MVIIIPYSSRYMHNFHGTERLLAYVNQGDLSLMLRIAKMTLTPLPFPHSEV